MLLTPEQVVRILTHTRAVRTQEVDDANEAILAIVRRSGWRSVPGKAYSEALADARTEWLAGYLESVRAEEREACAGVRRNVRDELEKAAEEDRAAGAVMREWRTRAAAAAAGRCEERIRALGAAPAEVEAALR